MRAPWRHVTLGALKREREMLPVQAHSRPPDRRHSASEIPTNGQPESGFGACARETDVRNNLARDNLLDVVLESTTLETREV